MNFDPRPLTDPLAIYLNDHLAAATGAAELFGRAAAGAPDGRAEQLRALADEVAADRDALLELMGQVEVPVRHYKVAAGWAGEKVGRLKLNGQIVGRAPLSALVEVEAMLLSVHGKAAAWRSVRAAADTDARLDVGKLDALLDRAEHQAEVLEQLRQDVAHELFAGQPAH